MAWPLQWKFLPIRPWVLTSNVFKFYFCAWLLVTFFEVFCQTPKTGLISICLLHIWTYNHPRKAISFRKEGLRGWSKPLRRALPLDHVGVSAPIPRYRIYGWMTLTNMWVPICLYCSNCTKFGQLILRKIIKIVATRCQILRLKCTKFDFGWGSPRPPS